MLRDHLAAARVGQGSLVLIGGEAGIGKTTLAEALCREAVETGALVLTGRCYDLTETPPYGPWVELFAHYRVTGDLPPLPAAFAKRGTIGEVTSEAALFQQVQDFLIAATTERPLVLLLDDLHWADPASLDLLRFIARDADASALVLIVTYRSDEITRRHPLYQLLPVLDREAHATRLDPRGLPADAVQTLVARYGLTSDDADRLVHYLDARAEGNAFFLTQLLQSLEEAAVLHQTDEGWILSDLARVQVPMPLKQVIDGRLARLGDEAQRLLSVAAVIGQEVPLALWAAVAGADEETLFAVIEQGAAARLIEETSDGMQARFVHALIRETLYEGILPSRRRHMHRQVGEALVVALNPDPDAIAYHFRQAGDMRAAEWLIKAGERAQQAYAWLTAADRYEAALPKMEQTEANLGERGWLLYRIARMLRFHDPKRSVAYLDAAMKAAIEIGDHALAALALYSRGGSLIFGGERTVGISQSIAGVTALDALSAEEKARLNQREDPQNSATYRGTPVLHLAIVGRIVEAVKYGERARTGTPTLTGLGDLGRFSYGDKEQGLGIAYALLGQPEEAAKAFAQARVALHAAGHFATLGMAVMNEMALLALPYRGDRVTECQQLAAVGMQARLLAQHAAADPTRLSSVQLLTVEGDWEEARAIALAAIAPSNSTYLRHSGYQMLGPLARLQGEPKMAWTAVRELLPNGPSSAPGGQDFHDAMALLRLAAALALDTDDLETARAWLEAHDRWLAWSGAVLGQSEGQALWAAYYRVAGDTAAAYESATRALTHATKPRQPLALLAAHRLLGALDTDAGRYDVAEAHLQESLTLANACAAPYERALTLLALAARHAAMRNTAAATTLLDEVRAICTPLGAMPALARADALAARLATLKDAPPAYPAGLSAREVEVLRLVAAGCTNRAIADTLFLSEHTVRVHLRNILTKTDSANRTEAATFALRNGLA